ncbi:MAG: CPBP family intramembrane glutamic endopeptidase [Planctomycetota bacterium]
MLAVVLLLTVPVMMWLGQSALLYRAGLPLRLRLGAADLPRPLKRINRGVTHAAFAAALLAYPLLRSVGSGAYESPLAYYARYLPPGRGPAQFLFGCAAAVLYLALLYLAWLLSGNVHFRVRHGPARLAQRLTGAPLTALLIAFVEELLFRAMLLAGLLEWLGPGGTPAAVALGALAFAGAHYVRAVKRYWTFAGHVALGVLLCAAFVATGNVWLSWGLHAGGVLMLMAVRPLVRYTGPAWLVGASIFPYAGLAGIVGLGLLTLNVWLCCGASR